MGASGDPRLMRERAHYTQLAQAHPESTCDCAASIIGAGLTDVCQGVGLITREFSMRETLVNLLHLIIPPTRLRLR